MRIAIKGIGVVGGFGCGVTDLDRALHSRDNNSEIVSIPTPKGPVEMPVLTADTSGIEKFVPKRSLRRIDHFSRMAVLGAYLALEDAGKLEDPFEKDMGIIVASGYGPMRTTFAFLDSVINEGDECASPMQFSNSVHNAAAAHISILLKAPGPNLTVSQFEMSMPMAILTACQWLEGKRVNSVLVGGVDEYCDVLGYCRRRFFDEGSLPKGQTAAGEGAAFFLLTRDDSGESSYGFIKDISIEKSGQNREPFPDNTILILNSDEQMNSNYSFPENTETAVYSPLYGIFPVGMGFDIAIAAISFKSGKCFASFENISEKSIQNNRMLGSQQLSCIKLAKNNRFSFVSLSKK